MDFTDERVRVNAVGPGTIDTPGACAQLPSPTTIHHPCPPRLRASAAVLFRLPTLPHYEPLLCVCG